MSELSDEECVAFLEDYGVEIPAIYENEIDCVPFVRFVIEHTETNPDDAVAYTDPRLLRFANEIKMAIREFYGVADVSTYVINNDPDTLEDSIPHGDWSDEFWEYNCYGYAIDKHYIYEKLSPGFTESVRAGYEASSYQFDDTADIYTIANLVKTDLEYYGYTVNPVTMVMPNTQVSSHTHLICVRKDLQRIAYTNENGETVLLHDFHFMKLGTDGAWYHKSGLTGVLKYSSVPSSGVAWVQEGYYKLGELFVYFHEDNCTYDSDIYFIEYTTPHKWENATTNNNETHTLTCSVCGGTKTEDCELEYTCVNTYYHKGTCADCGYTTEKTSCKKTYSYVGNGSGKHTATCSVCNKSVVFNCSLQYTYYNSGKHRAVCSVCNKAFYESCAGDYVYMGSATVGDVHSVCCDDCDHVLGTEIIDCTFDYVFAGTVNGSNTHNYQCTGCGHVKTYNTLCFYKTGDTCFYCGTSRDTTGTAATNGSESAE